MKKTLIYSVFIIAIVALFSSCRNDNNSDSPSNSNNKQYMSFTTTQKVGTKLVFEHVNNHEGGTVDIDWGDGKIVAEKVINTYPEPNYVNPIISGIVKGSTIRIFADKGDVEAIESDFALSKLNVAAVDLSKIPDLTSISLFGNTIKSVDFSNNKKLIFANLSDNPLTPEGLLQIANTLPTADKKNNPEIIFSKTLTIPTNVRSTITSKNFTITLWP